MTDAAEAFGAVVRAEPSSKQTVSVRDMNDVAGTTARRTNGACDEMGPRLDVVSRVAHDGRLSRRSARGVDPNNPLHAVRRTYRRVASRRSSLVVKGKYCRSAKRLQVVGMNTGQLALAPVCRHVLVGMA